MNGLHTDFTLFRARLPTVIQAKRTVPHIAKLLIKCVALIVVAFGALPLSAEAQSRPGIDRPIRVGMFKGIASSRFWHTNAHTASSVLGEILANPAAAGLGDSLVIPPAGFIFYSMPVALNSAGTAECTGGGCGPTPEQLITIVASLDTLDVLVMNSNTDIGNRISDVTQRQAFESFWAKKGFVSIHQTIDSYGVWPLLDTVQGARFRGHPAEQNGTVRRDSVYAHEPHWQYLNRGIFSGGPDTTFFEEWMWFLESGSVIRSRAHLKPTVNLVEASVANPGSQTPMGDHPMSWYRPWPTGGRTFYTAVGHRSQVWQTTRMFRRQVYNAILWSAKYDSMSTVSVAPGAATGSFKDYARVSGAGSAFVVTMMTDGPHTVEILGLDGKRVEQRQGVGRAQHDFPGLRAGVYVVNVDVEKQRTSKLVRIP